MRLQPHSTVGRHAEHSHFNISGLSDSTLSFCFRTPFDVEFVVILFLVAAIVKSARIV